MDGTTWSTCRRLESAPADNSAQHGQLPRFALNNTNAVLLIVSKAIFLAQNQAVKVLTVSPVLGPGTRADVGDYQNPLERVNKKEKKKSGRPDALGKT